MSSLHELRPPSPQDFPATGSAAAKLAFLLRYAVLAPSNHNTQPWLFHLAGDTVELYADRTRHLRVVDPEDRQLLISCGCALHHLRVAARRFGCLGTVDLFPDASDEDLLARVTLGDQGGQDADAALLFDAIPRRQTNRQPFDETPVSEELLAALRTGSARSGAHFRVVEGSEAREAAGQLVGVADRQQWASKRFRLELAAWMHPGRTANGDGIPGYAQGMNDMLSVAGPLVIRTFDMGEGQAAKDRDIAVYSPVLALFWTDRDGPRDWLAAGEALSFVLLRARASGVWASFLNQPIEIPELRAHMRETFALPGWPQLMIRMGHASDVRPTPRRAVEEVLI